MLRNLLLLAGSGPRAVAACNAATKFDTASFSMDVVELNRAVGLYFREPLEDLRQAAEHAIGQKNPVEVSLVRKQAELMPGQVGLRLFFAVAANYSADCHIAGVEPDPLCIVSNSDNPHRYCLCLCKRTCHERYELCYLTCARNPAGYPVFAHYRSNFTIHVKLSVGSMDSMEVTTSVDNIHSEPLGEGNCLEFADKRYNLEAGLQKLQEGLQAKWSAAYAVKFRSFEVRPGANLTWRLRSLEVSSTNSLALQGIVESCLMSDVGTYQPPVGRPGNDCTLIACEAAQYSWGGEVMKVSATPACDLFHRSNGRLAVNFTVDYLPPVSKAIVRLGGHYELKIDTGIQRNPRRLDWSDALITIGPCDVIEEVGVVKHTELNKFGLWILIEEAPRRISAGSGHRELLSFTMPEECWFGMPTGLAVVTDFACNWSFAGTQLACPQSLPAKLPKNSSAVVRISTTLFEALNWVEHKRHMRTTTENMTMLDAVLMYRLNSSTPFLTTLGDGRFAFGLHWARLFTTCTGPQGPRSAPLLSMSITGLHTEAAAAAHAHIDHSGRMHVFLDFAPKRHHFHTTSVALEEPEVPLSPNALQAASRYALLKHFILNDVFAAKMARRSLLGSPC